MATSAHRKIHDLLRRAGTARSQELVTAGATRSELSRLVAAGKLLRVARGIYALTDHQASEHGSLASVVKRAPGVVFCLLTALRLHDLTTQSPSEVWIAIGNKTHPPRMDYPPLRTVRFSEASLQAGVEVRQIDGTAARITNPAKTVADCFKFRSKIGLDVAIEALRDALRSRKASLDDLWRYAQIDRVSNVMRPYLDSAMRTA